MDAYTQVNSINVSFCQHIRKLFFMCTLARFSQLSMFILQLLVNTLPSWSVPTPLFLLMWLFLRETVKVIDLTVSILNLLMKCDITLFPFASLSCIFSSIFVISLIMMMVIVMMITKTTTNKQNPTNQQTSSRPSETKMTSSVSMFAHVGLKTESGCHRADNVLQCLDPALCSS